MTRLQEGEEGIRAHQFREAFHAALSELRLLKSELDERSISETARASLEHLEATLWVGEARTHINYFASAPAEPLHKVCAEVIQQLAMRLVFRLAAPTSQDAVKFHDGCLRLCLALLLEVLAAHARNSIPRDSSYAEYFDVSCHVGAPNSRVVKIDVNGKYSSILSLSGFPGDDQVQNALEIHGGSLRLSPGSVEVVLPALQISKPKQQ